MAKEKKGFVKRKPTTEEIASAKRDYDLFQGYIKVIQNPDRILQKTQEGMSKGIKLFEEMEIDDQISSCLQQRQQAVLTKDWDILPASDSRKDKKIAEFVKNNLKKIGLKNDLFNILDGVPKGFSICEIMWDIQNGEVIIKDIKGREQRRFSFDLDNKLRLLTFQNMLEGEPVPERKFIHFAYNSKYENPYGSAVLSRCFWPWWFKKHVIKFWMIFLEKFGSPTAVGQYPSHANDKQKDNLLEACEAIQQEFAVIIPEGFKIELLEAQRRGATDSYDNFKHAMDTAIAKVILGSTLAIEEAKFGTRAQATVHKEVTAEIIESDATHVQEVFNTQLIPWLVDYNFNVEEYPKFKIFYEAEDVGKEMAERDKTLFVDMGLPVGVDFLYQKYHIPKPTEGEELLQVPRKAQTQTFVEEKQIEIDEQVEQEDQKTVKLYEDHGRIISQAIEESLTIYNQQFIEEFKKKLNKAKDFKDLLKLKVNLKELEDLILGALLVSNLKGRLDVKNEITFQEAEYGNLPFQNAINYFKQKIPLPGSVFKKLNDDYKKIAFTLKEIENLYITEKVYSEILKSLEEGTTFEQFKRTVDEFFDRIGITRITSYRLQTIYNTNLSQAYNAGRWQQLSDPDMADLIPYYRYIAILDSRVRPDHAKMHGYTARRDDPIWNRWWPPNGYNCRCGVRGISKFEAERLGIVPTKGRPPFTPDSGFDTNPGKLSDTQKKLSELVKEKKIRVEDLTQEIKKWT